VFFGAEMVTAKKSPGATAPEPQEQLAPTTPPALTLNRYEQRATTATSSPRPRLSRPREQPPRSRNPKRLRTLTREHERQPTRERGRAAEAHPTEARVTARATRHELSTQDEQTGTDALKSRGRHTRQNEATGNTNRPTKPNRQPN
jgi:hypothetical protein